MRHVRLLIAAFVFLAAVSRVFAAERAVHHVVLISVDGLPASLVNDPAVPLETIRALGRAGVMAEGMTVSNPSVTWPNHTTLVTGTRPVDHGVLFNGVLERSGLGMPVQVNPRTDKSELVLIPTIVDELHAQGRTVVGINWPCTRNSPAFQIDFPDSPEMMKYTTPAFLDDLIQAGLVPEDIRTSFDKMPVLIRDSIWTKAACYALEHHRPALTLVHLLNLDSTHHRYGPGTPAGYTAMAFADTCVRQIVETLDRCGMRASTAVIVVSDHGFMSIPKTVLPNVLLRKAGLLTVEGTKITAANVHAYPEGGIAMVYLTRPDTQLADQQKAIELFEHAEGIARVLTPDHFEELGLPQPDEYPQMANLILVAEDGYGFGGGATGEDSVIASDTTLGTHGFLSTNPRMNATFVAEGAGIRTGLHLGVIDNIQVAPTIAKLLDVPLKSAKGAPLDAILDAGQQ